MSSRNTKAAKRAAKISVILGTDNLNATCEKVAKTLAIDNRLRKPVISHVKGHNCSVRTARATKHGAKKPFVINK